MKRKIVKMFPFVENYVNRYKYVWIKKRIRKTIDVEPIRVGFLGYLDGPSCDVFTSLYHEFSRDKRFVCHVVTVPYTHDDKDKMIQKHQDAVQYLNSLGIEPLIGYDKETDSFRDYKGWFDIVFFEIEYDWVLPIFKVENFRSALTFLIPYGQFLADNISHHMSFKMMSEVYRIFPTSFRVKDMMKKYSLCSGWNVLDEYLGNPKIDRFFDSNSSYQDVWTKSRPSQRRIIWAPHHTWANYSNFLQYSEFFLDYAEHHQNEVFIAIKPHPALKDSLEHVNNWNREDISDYFSRWKNGSNTDLFEGEWFDLFKSSDAMILDSVGFMLEYSLTGKPACVMYRLDEKNERDVRYSECGEEVFDILYHAKNEEEIIDYIEMIIRNEDPMMNNRNQFIIHNYQPPFGLSGSRNIYNYVIKEIGIHNILK